MANDEVEPLLEELTDEENLIGEEESFSEPDSDARLREKLGSDERSRLAEQQELVAQIIADPDVRAVLKAKENGENVKVISGETEIPSRTPNVLDFPAESMEEEVDVEEMSNRQLMKRFGDQIISSVNSSIDKKLKGVNDRLGQIDGYVNQVEKKEANKQIEAAQKKFSDFEDYRTMMHGIYQNNPNLSIDELYALAKIRTGHPISRDKNLESERPTSTSGRPRPNTRRNESLPPGTKGRRIAMDEAFEHMKGEVDLGALADSALGWDPNASRNPKTSKRNNS